MVDVKSPEWLPPGFTEKFKYKDGRKIKYYYNVATGVKYHSKKDVLSFATSANVVHGTPETTNDLNELSSNNKVDAILDETIDSPDSLPSGWLVEEKTRKGLRKGSSYKIYTDMSSGSKFYSRAAVDRYLNSVHSEDTTALQNKVDNVDEPLPDMSPQLDNVDEPLQDSSLQSSITNAGLISEKKKKDGTFKPVSYVSTPADGLPHGWIKEIIISKSGTKTRTDPYYTDPNSGYVFRSKPDALRFQKNGDVRYCASRPKRKEDLQLIKSEIPSSNGNASEDHQTKAQLLPDEEINGGGEFSLNKVQADSNDNDESDNAKVIAKDMITNTSTEQKLPKKQTHKTQLSLRKSKKRKEETSLPSRASKRLANCEPEILNESALKVETLPNLPLNSPASIPTEPLKEEKPLQEIEPSNKIENPLPTEGEAVEEEQKQKDESKKSEFCYGFEGSWSDPCLEFAFKTLTGEISIEDGLAFPGCFEDRSKSVKIAPHSESSKAVDQSMFSGQSNNSFLSFGCFNNQNSSMNKDHHTKFNP